MRAVPSCVERLVMYKSNKKINTSHSVHRVFYEDPMLVRLTLNGSTFTQGQVWVCLCVFMYMCVFLCT